MTSIVAGRAKGRRLVVPPGSRTRPTSSRAREGLFSALESELGAWDDVAVLDLFAGSGALGLEAASRGARPVTLVESERSAWHACRENVTSLAIPGVELVRADVIDHLRVGAPRAYDVVLADPPYAMAGALVTETLELLLADGWLHDDAIVVVERGTHGADLMWPDGLQGTRSRRYGDAVLWYGRRQRDERAEPPDPTASAHDL